MRTRRPKAALVLSAEQRDELERWVRRRRTAQPLAMRARIIAFRGLSTDHSEKSSKTFCCPVSPSARRTASWKSLNAYRTIVGGVSAPFDNMVSRSLVAARTSASGWELTQRGSHHPRTVVVE
jgi:hypothetical protein